MSPKKPAFVASDGVAQIELAPMSMTALFNHRNDR
jgi:hypothetical protein